MQERRHGRLCSQEPLKGMNEGDRIGQRVRLRWGIVVVTEISADPTEQSGTRVALQSWPE